MNIPKCQMRQAVVSGPMDVLPAGKEVGGVNRCDLEARGWEDLVEIYAFICPERVQREQRVHRSEQSVHQSVGAEGT